MFLTYFPISAPSCSLRIAVPSLLLLLSLLRKLDQNTFHKTADAKKPSEITNRHFCFRERLTLVVNLTASYVHYYNARLTKNICLYSLFCIATIVFRPNETENRAQKNKLSYLLIICCAGWLGNENLTSIVLQSIQFQLITTMALQTNPFSKKLYTVFRQRQGLQK